VSARTQRQLRPRGRRRGRPRRVQARRKGVRNYRSVMRPTVWGNPFRVDDADPATRARSLARFRRHLEARLRRESDFLEPLRGHDLGCTCPPALPCHADIILELLYGAAKP
jgi:hypothetical protein